MRPQFRQCCDRSQQPNKDNIATTAPQKNLQDGACIMSSFHLRQGFVYPRRAPGTRDASAVPRTTKEDAAKELSNIQQLASGRRWRGANQAKPRRTKTSKRKDDNSPSMTNIL